MVPYGCTFSNSNTSTSDTYNGLGWSDTSTVTFTYDSSDSESWNRDWDEAARELYEENRIRKMRSEWKGDRIKHNFHQPKWSHNKPRHR